MNNKNILKLILIMILLGVGQSVSASFFKILPIKKSETYQVPILVYHSFGPARNEKEGPIQKHYRVTASVFEEQMKYLSINQYHPISFATYVDSLRSNTKLPDKALVLTFDDGWVSQYKYAVPILEKYNFTGTFFIITNYVEGNYKAYMTWDNLKDLVKNNFDIESHTKSHLILTKLDPKKLADELSGSKKMLEDKLGIKVTTLAYPNYMQNEIVHKAAKLALYSGARAGWTPFKNSIDDIYELKSQEVVNNPNPFSSKRLPDLP